MAYTLVDWARDEHARFLKQQAELPRFQRWLCKIGNHRWHHLVHEAEVQRMTRLFLEQPLHLPFKKLNSKLGCPTGPVLSSSSMADLAATVGDNNIARHIKRSQPDWSEDADAPARS